MTEQASKHDRGKRRADLMPSVWVLVIEAQKMSRRPITMHPIAEMLLFAERDESDNHLLNAAQWCAEQLGVNAFAETCDVLTFGAGKYDAHNWRQGMQWSRLIAAALRHIDAHHRGVVLDPETGLPHVAHALCCILFLMDYKSSHPELDDRYES